MNIKGGHGRARLLYVVSILLCFGAAVATPVLGQTTSMSSPTQTTPQLGSTLCAQTLDYLPLGENVFAALETTQSEAISDRFNASGLNIGQPARVGAFLGSWSQTSYRIGDIDITDPSGSGAPLLFPELAVWDCVNVATGLMPSEFNPPGLGITFFPKPLIGARPGMRWQTSVRGSVAGGGLASPTPAGSVPPIERLNQFGHTSVVTTGSLIPDRLGLTAGGSWARASKFLREVTPGADSDLASAFANLVYSPSPNTQSRTLGWVQQTTVPFAYAQLFPRDASTRDRAVHLQSAFDSSLRSNRLHFSGGVTARSRHHDLADNSILTADRLTDGPIPAIASAADNQFAGRWMVRGRVEPKPIVSGNRQRHAVGFGGSVDRAFLRLSDQFIGTIGELVDRQPARRWFFSAPDEDSRRHATTVAAFATDQLTIGPNLTVDAGLRFESVTGRADSAATDVAWLTLLPRAVLRWSLGSKVIVGGYRRAANQLNLDLLAFGDPNAQTATVTRFLTAPLAAAAIIDRVGPGTGGNPQFSTVNPNLKRPVTDEYVIGIESQRFGWLQIGATGTARREANAIAVADVGVPLTSYSTIGIPDPGHDFASPDDDQVLTAYNRLPGSYGRNQYLVTNTTDPAATMFALKLWAYGATNKVLVLFGATASMANGAAANRGYGPLENDQDLVGELLTDPNATTFARGRLFSDRAFTAKWTTTYLFPKDIRLGVIARYQDGQPFARLVAVPDLNQGPELIRAYPNAGNRFTFTGTLDIRIQKGLTFGKQHLDGIIDFYNLATRSNEVEEYTVTGSNFRTPTAIEPPRSIHVGFRLLL